MTHIIEEKEDDILPSCCVFHVVNSEFFLTFLRKMSIFTPPPLPFIFIHDLEDLETIILGDFSKFG